MIKIRLVLISLFFCVIGISTLGQVQAASYSEEVYQAQLILSERGYNPGPSDGLWEKKTRNAIKRFQAKEGLPITGRLDEKTKLSLGILRVDSDSFVGESEIRKAALSGDAKAQNNLGLMYANGEGVTKSYQEAVKWIRKAAQQGFAMAQNALRQIGAE